MINYITIYLLLKRALQIHFNLSITIINQEIYKWNEKARIATVQKFYRHKPIKITFLVPKVFRRKPFQRGRKGEKQSKKQIQKQLLQAQNVFSAVRAESQHPTS